eukprot:4231692-Karenia_brevis.AAC.1
MVPPVGRGALPPETRLRMPDRHPPRGEMRPWRQPRARPTQVTPGWGAAAPRQSAQGGPPPPLRRLEDGSS